PATSNPPVTDPHALDTRARAIYLLHSFPTRRSSDLDATGTRIVVVSAVSNTAVLLDAERRLIHALDTPSYAGRIQRVDQPPFGRSEEHTSELQSQSKLVCRLLLEKKQYGFSQFCS